MNVAIVAAAGHGSRTGKTVPKQFTKIGGKPLVCYTVEKLLQSGRIDRVLVAVNPDMLDYSRKMAETFLSGKNVFVTYGGESRNETLFNAVGKAVEMFQMSDGDIVLTHDSARPYVDTETIFNCLDALETFDVCTAVVNATDTLILSADGNEMTGALNRNEIYHSQTPQCFRLGAYCKMIEKITSETMTAATDICTLFAVCGFKVKLVQGNVENTKITFRHDLDMAKLRLKKDGK